MTVAGSAAELGDLVVADLVRAAAIEIDEVIDVRPADRSAAATHGPARRVPGVEIRRGDGSGRASVHIEATLTEALPTLGERVRGAVITRLDAEVPQDAPWIVDVVIAHLSEETRDAR